MATNDNADVKATTDRDFYPEDAQERNFAEARRLSVENHEKDQAALAEDRERAEKLEAAEDETARKNIPAQPTTKSDVNPEQVQTTDSPADQTNKSSKKK